MIHGNKKVDRRVNKPLILAGSLVDMIFLAPSIIAQPFKKRRDITRDQYERELDFYIDSGYVDNPESFFTFPSVPPSFEIIDRRKYYDGESQLIRYTSGYQVKNPLVSGRYNSFEANRTGYIVRWTHGSGKRKTVLCHHGYMLGQPDQAKKMFRVDSLFSRGVDVALFVAPFHWRRSPEAVMKRGIYLQQDDPAMTAECIGQNMHDLYSSFLILRELGSVETGLIGASLGGYNTALFISLTDIAFFGAMMVPALDFSKPLGPDYARFKFRVDSSLRGKARRVWGFHSPLNMEPKIPVERILVAASRGDMICPFEYVDSLCNKWEIRNKHYLTGGHWLIFDGDRRGRAWYRFLSETGFIPG